MSFTSGPIRFFVVAVLAVGLVGGNAFAPLAMADCPMAKSVDTSAGNCCCGASCHCGPSCGVKKADPQDNKQTNSQAVVQHDRTKINTPAGKVDFTPLAGGFYYESGAAEPTLAQSASTLLAQHTLLRV